MTDLIIQWQHGWIYLAAGRESKPEILIANTLQVYAREQWNISNYNL